MPYTGQVDKLEVACSGGLRLDRTSQNIPYGAATKLQNFEPSIIGGYRRVGGFTKYSTTALTGSGNVLGIHALGSNVIAARGANVEYGSGGTWTSITTGRTSAGRYHFHNYDWTGTDTTVMASGDAGTNPAATWNGSTYTLLNGTGSPTNPLDVKEHRGHLFFLQGNKVTISSPFAANDFSPSNGAMDFNLPDTGVALHPYRDILIVFCDDSIHKIVGSSSSNFELKPITRKLGCIAGWSIREIGGDLVFLAPDGLRTIASTERIDDTELGTISKAIQDRLNNLTSSTYLISSTILRHKSQYRLFFPIRSESVTQGKGIIGVLKTQVATSPDEAFSADTGIGWEYGDMQGFSPTAASSEYVNGIERALHGDADGFIFEQDSGNSFNGSNIDSIFRTPDFTFGDTGIRKRVKRIIFNIHYEGTIAPTLQMDYDFGSTNVPQPALVTLGTPDYISLYGTAKYGDARYSIDPTALDRVWVVGSGFSVAFTLKTLDIKSSFTLQGFTMEFYPASRR